MDTDSRWWGYQFVTNSVLVTGPGHGGVGVTEGSEGSEEAGFTRNATGTSI